MKLSRKQWLDLYMALTLDDFELRDISGLAYLTAKSRQDLKVYSLEPKGSIDNLEADDIVGIYSKDLDLITKVNMKTFRAYLIINMLRDLDLKHNRANNAHNMLWLSTIKADNYNEDKASKIDGYLVYIDVIRSKDDIFVGVAQSTENFLTEGANLLLDSAELENLEIKEEFKLGQDWRVASIKKDGEVVYKAMIPSSDWDKIVEASRLIQTIIKE